MERRVPGKGRLMLSRDFIPFCNRNSHLDVETQLRASKARSFERLRSENMNS